jgi:hypothetical protein
MDSSIISALAALTGAAVGGLTSGAANRLNHRSQLPCKKWTLTILRFCSQNSMLVD